MKRISGVAGFAVAAALAVPVSGCGVALPEAQVSPTACDRRPACGTPAIEAEQRSAASGGTTEGRSSSAGVTRSALSLEAAEMNAHGAQASPTKEATVASTMAPVPTAMPAVLEEAPMAPTATTAAPPGTPTPVPPTPTPEPTPDFSAFPAQVVTLLNERRAEQGLAPLRTDGALQSAAMSHAAYMGRTGFVGHYPPNGTTPAGRIAAAGFQGTYQGEVLSGGQPRARQALAALLASPAHAAILLSSRPTAVGVGHSYAPGSVYTHYWVIVTGSP